MKCKTGRGTIREEERAAGIEGKYCQECQGTNEGTKEEHKTDCGRMQAGTS